MTMSFLSGNPLFKGMVLSSSPLEHGMIKNNILLIISVQRISKNISINLPHCGTHEFVLLIHLSEYQKL